METANGPRALGSVTASSRHRSQPNVLRDRDRGRERERQRQRERQRKSELELKTGNKWEGKGVDSLKYITTP